MEQERYRLGRKQKRVVLTQDGSKEVAQFAGDYAHLAQKVVDILNAESVKGHSIKYMSEKDLKYFIDSIHAADPTGLDVCIKSVMKDMIEIVGHIKYLQTELKLKDESWQNNTDNKEI